VDISAYSRLPVLLTRPTCCGERRICCPFPPARRRVPITNVQAWAALECGPLIPERFRRERYIAWCTSSPASTCLARLKWVDLKFKNHVFKTKATQMHPLKPSPTHPTSWPPLLTWRHFQGLPPFWTRDTTSSALKESAQAVTRWAGTCRWEDREAAG